MAWSVFSNGRIYTADASGSWAAAVAIQDGRFAAVGTAGEVRRAAGPGATEIDLGGRVAVPGMIDAHNHFLQTAHALTWADARYPGTASVADLVALIAAAAAAVPPGQWVHAYGLDHAKFPVGEFPTRWDLDRATADHPVLVHHVSGHHALVNSRALQQRVGLDPPSVAGGQFLRDPAGAANGWCLDAAMELVLPVAVDVGNHGPNVHFEADQESLVQALAAGSSEYLAAGLTTVCDAQVTRREFTAYREGRRRGTLGIRVVCMPLSSQLDVLAATGIAGPLLDDRLGIGPMKLYADGALTGGTACFRQPYGEAGEYPGLLYHEPEELSSVVSRAQADGWQVGIHAQGDRAISMALDAIEAGPAGIPEARHRIEHAGYPEGELDRIARLGVIPVSQPGYLYDFGDTFLRALGARAHRLVPLRDQLDRGIDVVLSSDSYVTTFRPMHHVAAAVNRRTRAGLPIGEDQALSVEEAIRGYTCNAARSFFAEDRVGSIEEGKAGDLVVFAEDPFTAAADRLGDIGVWMTVLGGTVAYQAADGAAGSPGGSVADGTAGSAGGSAAGAAGRRP
jgi:predicted amidohydrolase YtcJ